jgi:hypothetical protein
MGKARTSNTQIFRLGFSALMKNAREPFLAQDDKADHDDRGVWGEDDPQYIVRLIGQVIYVSLETVKIVKSLPELVVEATA